MLHWAHFGTWWGPGKTLEELTRYKVIRLQLISWLHNWIKLLFIILSYVNIQLWKDYNIQMLVEWWDITISYMLWVSIIYENIFQVWPKKHDGVIQLHYWNNVVKCSKYKWQGVTYHRLSLWGSSSSRSNKTQSWLDLLESTKWNLTIHKFNTQRQFSSQLATKRLVKQETMVFCYFTSNIVSHSMILFITLFHTS